MNKDKHTFFSHDDELLREWIDGRMPYTFYKIRKYLKERLELICWTIAEICSSAILILFVLYIISTL